MNLQVGTNLTKKDEQFLWHAMKAYNPDATIIIEKAEGSWLTDIHGKRYLDAMSGLWCVNVGYGNQEIANAAYEQLLKNNYTPLSMSHPSAILLAEKISEMLGDDYVVFFSNSGSEANETAFKIARQYFQQKGENSRYKIVSRYRAYHGNTMGALAATGQAERKYKYEPLAPGFLHVKAPDQYRFPEVSGDNPLELSSVKVIDEVMTWEYSDTIAAMIVEPIITGGGVIMPPDDYLQGVQQVCQKHGALLIVDEVICGFGRTGKAFGHQNYGVKPDIVTMAKGLTSAYMPLSATAVRREIYEAFMSNGQYDFFRHVNTFGGSPAACAVALKNLEIMERENLFSRSEEMGAILLKELENKLAAHPNIGNIRGKGLLIGIELVADRSTKEPLDVTIVNNIIAHCKNNGLIVGKNGVTVAGYNNVLTLSPPLNISLEEKDLIVSKLTEAIEAQ
ncbi:aspartate aminotransferase family protein [Lysinibacillus sp. 3P01SB]|uniref:aspartate aminotransferase family protein n=1 Tax=Lysinibacillus sp. 3P01SB TaxID=3132284 RepID=UPI0039A47A70